MVWLNVLMLLLGWVPVLGFLAGRAAPGVQGVLVLLPVPGLQTLGLLGARWVAQTVQNAGLEGGLWTALAWLGSPVYAALGRPLGSMIGDSNAAGFLLLFTVPALPGLVLGWLTGRPSRRL